jgi:nucleoside-diphosphate-sugar epimerase
LKSVLVTGAFGFVGRHLVEVLRRKGHSVIAVSRNAARDKALGFWEDVQVVECDVYENINPIKRLQIVPDVLVHLAWPGLPNYTNTLHLEYNLPRELAFFLDMLDLGVRHIVSAGTCLEYGNQYGPLKEADPTFPNTAYGLAKDSVRKTLEQFQSKWPFVLQWMRLFYVFGPGQSDRSLLSQLSKSISSGDVSFNMSPGDQLRDFLSIHAVAERFASVIENPEVTGVINCCSGQSVSVFDLASRFVSISESSIHLNRGAFGYPSYEPLAFWGVPEKLTKLGFHDFVLDEHLRDLAQVLARSG